MAISLPHKKKPCSECPFREDTKLGGLGYTKMANILKESSFVCHKQTDKQCAGHMLIRGERNQFVQLAKRLSIPLSLSGRELLFDNESALLQHYRSKNPE